MKKLIKILFPSFQHGSSTQHEIATNHFSKPTHADTTHQQAGHPTTAKDQHHHVIEHFRKTANDIANSGIVDGTAGIPGADVHQHCSAEEAISNHYHKAVQEINLIHKEHHQLTQQHLSEQKEHLHDESHHQVPQGQIDQAIHAAKHKAAHHVPLISGSRKFMHTIKMERTVTGVISALKEEHRQEEEKKKHYDTQHEHLMAHRYNRIPPIHQLIDHPGIFWAMIAVLFLLEIGANFKAFQAVGLGDMNVIAILFGVVFAIFQALSAKEVGFAIAKGAHKKRNMHLLATFFLCLFISLFRWNMEGSLFLKVAYTSINFLIAAATAIIAHAHARHHDFFSTLRNRHQSARHIKHLEHQMAQVETDFQSRIKEAELHIHHQVAQEEHAKKAHTQKLIHQAEAHLVHLESLLKHSLHQLEVIHGQAHATYRHLNQNARKTAGHPPVKHWHDHHPTAHLPSITKVASILLLLLIGFTGCSPVAESTHIEVLYDQTDATHHQDIDQMADFILSHVPVDTVAGKWGASTITLSAIGEISSPATHVVHLAPSEGFLYRNELEHKHHPHHFKAALKAALHTLTEPSPQMNHSYIHRNFHYRLQHLAKQSGKRIVLSWSDLILNHPPLNFYEYRQHPEQLMAHKDSLTAVMAENYPLPDLHGVHLVNIHQPSKLNDELHEGCKHLFAHHWQHHGMHVEFKTAIPHHHIHTAHHGAITGSHQ